MNLPADTSNQPLLTQEQCEQQRREIISASLQDHPREEVRAAYDTWLNAWEQRIEAARPHQRNLQMLFNIERNLLGYEANKITLDETLDGRYESRSEIHAEGLLEVWEELQRVIDFIHESYERKELIDGDAVLKDIRTFLLKS